MKKIAAWLLVGLFVAFPATVKAQGIEAGDHMFSMMIGGAAGLQDSGLTKWNNEKTDWGSAGAVFGLSYMIFPSEVLGVGIEVNDGIFVGEDDDRYIMGDHEELETAMNVFNAMVSARLNLNPQARARFYIPFGAGLSSATAAIRDTWNGSETTKRASYNSLGYFVGFGLEVALGSSGRWSLGAEGRYNAFQYDTDKLAAKWGGTGVGKKDYSYVSVAFKASCKF